MKHFTYETFYEKYEDCYFEFGNYIDTNNLALTIMSDTEGPIATVTVNVGRSFEIGVTAIKNYSENEGMLDWLYSMGFVKKVLYNIEQGFVSIPVVELDLNLVSKFVKEGALSE